MCAVSFGEGVEVEVSDRTAFDEAKFREALREGGFTITEAKESRQDG